MEAKHTPGPWYFGKMQGWGGVCITRRPPADYSSSGVVGDAPIATIVAKAPHWENEYPVEANARLIAAAPDLLQAVWRLLDDAYDYGMPYEHPARLQARAAIDKATATATEEDA